MVHEGLWVSEAILCDTIMVGAGHHTLTKSHSMSEWKRKRSFVEGLDLG